MRRCAFAGSVGEINRIHLLQPSFTIAPAAAHDTSAGLLLAGRIVTVHDVHDLRGRISKSSARDATKTVIRSAVRTLPAPAVRFLPPRLRRLRPPIIGKVKLGDLATTVPVSMDFGWDRGLAIDRYYIELFLERHSSDVRGRVLEIGDASYSERFGGPAVQKQDILHVHPGNPLATIVGDISTPDVLPRSAFDCVLLTQTLHLIYDFHAAVREVHESLKPGGVLLLTVPGISQIDRGEWGDDWFWAMAPAAVRRLLGDGFGEDNVLVESHGNVFAATTFLQGLALSEVPTSKLDVRDEAYPVIVTARAARARRDESHRR